jgi:hypothetical protein
MLLILIVFKTNHGDDLTVELHPRGSLWRKKGLIMKYF